MIKAHTSKTGLFASMAGLLYAGDCSEEFALVLLTWPSRFAATLWRNHRILRWKLIYNRTIKLSFKEK
jgi:hypothetical protein